MVWEIDGLVLNFRAWGLGIEVSVKIDAPTLEVFRAVEYNGTSIGRAC